MAGFITGVGFGCTSLRKNLLSNEISFDKVKLEVVRSEDRFVAKGHIEIYKDSCIKFKFYGPLGFEVLKGSYNHSLDYFNELDKKEVTDFDKVIFSTYGIEINRRCVEFILTGDLNNLSSELTKLNQDPDKVLISIHKQEVFITNPRNSDFIKITYSYYQGFPKKIYFTGGTRNIQNFQIQVKYIDVKY